MKPVTSKKLNYPVVERVPTPHCSLNSVQWSFV